MTNPEVPDDADAELGFSDADLRALLERARANGDDDLRRLVSAYITLRRLAGDAVEMIQTQFGGATVVSASSLLRLRDLTRRR